MNANYHSICSFLYREARLLDDRQWDEWLECYSQNAQYWMPCWDDDDQLTEDPHSEISLIFYPNRHGLEDRVFRIKTERSGASTPEPRTAHMLSNIEILAEWGDQVDVRYNFLTMNHRYRVTDQFFGTIYLSLSRQEQGWLIEQKKVVLKNDYIRQVIDVYHI